jgi:hypothetical protein
LVSFEEVIPQQKTSALVIISGLIAITALSSTVATVFATPSPNGPGQPGAPGTTCGSPGATQTPGNSASNTGSPFAGGTSDSHYAGNPGTASLAHANSPHAVSQYDIACFQATQH